MVHRNLREAGPLMPHTLAGCGRRNVRDEEDVLDIVHDNPSTSRRHICPTTGRLSESAVWRTLRENQLFPFHVQPVQGLQPGDKHLHLKFSWWLLYRIVDTTQFLCRVVNLRGSIYKKWCTQSTQLACMGNGESSWYTLLLIPVHIQCQLLGRNYRWWRNRTACNTGSSRCSALRRFSWRNASTFIWECASICAREHVVSTRRLPSAFFTSSAQLVSQELSGQTDWAWRSDRMASISSRSDHPRFWLVGMHEENVCATKSRDLDDQLNRCVCCRHRT
jgi:hypothetical protein